MGLTLNRNMIPWVLVGAVVAYLVYRQRQADTVLDRRYPNAYNG
jgi:hypothetical protein